MQPLTRRQGLLGPSLSQQQLLLLGVVLDGLRRPCGMLLLRRRRWSTARGSCSWLLASRPPHAVQDLPTRWPVPHRTHDRGHSSSPPLRWEGAFCPCPWGRDLRRRWCWCWCRLPRLLRLPPPLSLLRSKVLFELALLLQGVELSQLLHLLQVAGAMTGQAVTYELMECVQATQLVQKRICLSVTVCSNKPAAIQHVACWTPLTAAQPLQSSPSLLPPHRRVHADNRAACCQADLRGPCTCLSVMSCPGFRSQYVSKEAMSCLELRTLDPRQQWMKHLPYPVILFLPRLVPPRPTAIHVQISSRVVLPCWAMLLLLLLI